MCSVFMMTTVFAGTPLWTFEPLTATTIAVPANGTAMVQYRITNQSSKPHTLTMQPIRGITQVTTGLNGCGNPFVLRGKNSCILSLQINGSQLNGSVMDGPVVCQQGSTSQCYRPSSINILRITQAPPITDAVIAVNPTTLLFAENSTGNVTVTNDAGSPVAAENVAATIPGGSNISVQSTTCGANLAIGASCTITFASATQEGPTTIPIAGDNTNTVNVDVTVTSQPQISITNPVQQSRVVTVSGTALSLEVTNDVGSAVNANAVTVSDKAACPNLSVDDSNCASVAPGASCMLELTSNTPYAPCTITVSGSNTANSPQALIAFSHLGGLVFEESGGSGKVVTGPLAAFDQLSQWSSQFNDIATDLDDGAQNTTNIINNDAGCTSVDNCAARRCQNISADWYLPARNELSAVHNALCSNLANPCNFGGFLFMTFYWSSSQDTSPNAWDVLFPSGDVNVFSKNTFEAVRCVRAF
nr:DUF1566 domain-containing protein [Legionella sp. PL877]